MAAAIELSQMHGSRKKAISGSSSSSPPKVKEEEEVEKTVYLCANSYKKHTEVTNWYIINLSSKDCSKKRKKKTGRVGRRRRGGKKPIYIESILRNMPLPWGSCLVALGSAIYCTSAAKYASSDVLVCDTTNTNSLQWEAVTAMNLKRESCYSEAVTADGKIYVFGGFRHHYRFQNAESIDEKSVCEVFDPSKNEWEPIHPLPPKQLILLCREADLFALYDDTEGRIILGSRLSVDGVLFTYGVRDATWGTLPQKFPASRFRADMSRPAFYDSTLYWIEIHGISIRGSGVYAYDFNLGMLVHGIIMGLHHFFWGSNSRTMQLHHFRGDEFYLIWIDSSEVVRCERVQISKRIDMQKQEGSLTAYVLSTKTYILDTEAYGGIGAVVL